MQAFLNSFGHWPIFLLSVSSSPTHRYYMEPRSIACMNQILLLSKYYCFGKESVSRASKRHKHCCLEPSIDFKAIGLILCLVDRTDPLRVPDA
jgi:hypothetical protein